MKVLIATFAILFSIHAFASGPILPEDLEETEMLLVKEIAVSWDKPVNEVRYNRSCDGSIYHRTLVLVPANEPFDLSFHEFVDYQDEFSRPFPGVWKDDELNGVRRLLFQSLDSGFIVLKTKTVPAKEFRIAIYGHC